MPEDSSRKGRQHSAQGFNQVLTLGPHTKKANRPERAAGLELPARVPCSRQCPCTVGRRSPSRPVYFVSRAETTFAALLLRRSARFWCTTRRFAALSRLEAKAFSSISALALSLAATAVRSLFCCRLRPVRTLLFRSVRCSVCRARLAADRVFAIVKIGKSAEAITLHASVNWEAIAYFE
jgi:hypothetical protein